MDTDADRNYAVGIAHQMKDPVYQRTERYFFLNPKFDHQTVKKSYCNAVDFSSASGSPIDSCLIFIQQSLYITA